MTFPKVLRCAFGFLLLIAPVLAFGAAAPSVSVSAPASPLIGDPIPITLSFDNTDPAQAGFGPYIDLFLPATGVDGTGAAIDDGISVANTIVATYLGSPLTTTVLTFDASGNVTHPYAVNAAGVPIVVNISSFPTAKAGDQLVVIQLPFGSFTPTQPPADVNITAQLSNLSDLGAPLQIHARGGFQFGNDALNNPATDPSIVGGNSTAIVTPSLIRFTKTYIGPEGETATGPNFKRQYRIDVTVAAGQTVTNLQVTDTLPNTIQYDSFVSATPVGTPALPIAPSGTTPGGTVQYTFASILGTGGADASFTFQFFVPRIDSTLAPIINAVSGDDVQIDNNISATYTWATPLDGRDTGMTATFNPPGPEATFTAKSIAIQKTASIINDLGVAGPTPGDTVEYTLYIQVSDYFAFQNLVVDDLLSDGQRFNGFAPTLSWVEHAGAGPTQPMNAANYSVTINTDGILNNNTPVNEGTSALQFRLSNEMITRGFDGKLVGGGLPDAGTGAGALPNNPPMLFGGTTAVIRYQVVIQDKFTDNAPSNEPALNARDILNNTVQVSGDLLQVNDVTTLTGQSEADGSSASLEIAHGQLVKSIYAINGNTSLPTPPTPIQISPGDTLTYRLRYTLPAGDVENLRLRDFLPLPIFKAGNPALDGSSWVFDDVTNATPPAAGHAHFGPVETLRPLGPTLSGTATANLTGNTVTSVTVNSTGTAYTTPPPISFYAPPGSGAAAIALLNPTSVASVTVLNPGVYTSAPAVSFTGGGGTGATGTALLGVGAVNVNNGGTGFTSAPAVNFTGGGGAGAVATTNMGVGAVNVTAGGSGFTAPPFVNITGGGGNGASALAFLSPLTVTSIVVTNAGSGYATPPAVTITGGGGTGTTATATVSGGLVTGINVTAPGSGFLFTPTVTLTGGGGTGATATASVTGSVAGIAVVSSGSGYTSTPAISFIGGNGTGATANSTLLVKIVNVTAAGSGYSSAPAINFTGGGGAGATATSTLGLAAVTVTAPGSGYTTLPSVNFTGGGGNGGTATAVLNPSTLASISMINGGSGYTTVPAVTVGLNIPPIVTTNTASGNNTVIFDYGTYSNQLNTSQEIDILLSVKVASDPYADNLFMTNQAQSAEGSTQQPTVEINDNKIIQVVLTEPSVQAPAKGIVGYENTSIPITGTPTISATVRVATTGVLTGAVFSPTGGSQSNGGFTSAPTVIDGVTLASGDLVLVKDQAAPAQNGIYSVLNAGTQTWERWTSFDESGEIIPGYMVFVSQGNTLFNFYYAQQTASVTVNTTGIVWSQQSTAPITFVPPAGGTSDFSGGPLGSTNIGTTDLLSGVVDAGDTVRFAIAMTNSGRSDAYNVRFGDTVPNGFIKPGSAAGLNLIVRRGDNAHTALTGTLVAETVTVATTAALPGATFTTTANGTFTFAPAISAVDGVILKTNDRILVKNQATASQNGVYVVVSPTSWVRTTDFDTAGELSGSVVGVRAGTSVGRTFTAGAVATLNTSSVNYSLDPTVPGFFYNYNAATGVFFIELADNYVAGPGTGTGGLNRGKDVNGLPLGDGTNMVVATYDLTLGSTVQPCSTIRNSAILLNFAGAPGADSYPAGQTDGADTMIKHFALAKTVVNTSLNQTGNNNLTQATIGETIRYSLTVTVPEGTSPSTVLTDTLDSGLAFVSISSVSASAGITALLPTIGATPANTTITSSGSVITFNLGAVTNSDTNNATIETITIVYDAVVLDILANQAGTLLNNSASLTHNYTNSGTGLPTGTLACGAGPVSAAVVAVVEPQLTITKGVAPTTAGPFNPTLSGLDGGDSVAYQLVITNPAANSTFAYDLFLQDIVPATVSGLAVNSVAVTNAAGAAGGQVLRTGGGPLLTSDFTFTGNTLGITGGITLDIVPDTRLVIVVTGALNNTVSPGATVQNDGTIRWSSLSGAITNVSLQNPASDERTGGSLVPLPNVNSSGDNSILDNYAATSTATITTTVPVLVKTFVTTSESDTGNVGGVDTVAIGEIVRYRLAITLPEGTSTNLQVVDNLPPGMRFLNDGSARVAFISNNNAITSTSPGALPIGLGTAPNIAGSAVVAPTFPFPAGVSTTYPNIGIDSSVATDTDGYSSGTDVFFKLGTIVNSDNDGDSEFIVIEFNALVENTAANQAGVNLDNSATLNINGGVLALNVTAGGSYVTAPTVSFGGGGGAGAAATALLGTAGVNTVTIGSGGTYTSVPTVNFSGGGGSGTTGTANLTATSLGSINLTAGGSGFTTVPSATVTGTATLAAVLTPTSIASLTLGAAGNYADPPRVTISGGGGSGATATAIMEVLGSTILSGGSGYATAPTVTISGGGGAGALATATVSGGVVTSISITNPGGGYTSRPTISFTGGGGSGAAANPTLRVESLTVLTAGSGFTSTPSVTFTGGGGSGGATAAAVFAPTSIASINVVSGGSGYTTVPVVTIAGGGGTGAAATAALTPTPIASVTVSAAGSGYSSPPIVLFTGGGGVTGATATANLVNRAVTSLIITNPGSGYTSAPTVAFAPAGAAATSTINISSGTVTVRVVEPQITNLRKTITTIPTDAGDNVVYSITFSNTAQQVNPYTPTVRAATTAASDTSSATFSSAGTAGRYTNAPLTIDGVTLAVNDRVLVKNDGTASRNGIYKVTATSATGSTLERATDFDTAAEINQLYRVNITSGTTNVNRVYSQDNVIATLNTTSIAFTQVTSNPAVRVATSTTMTGAYNAVGGTGGNGAYTGAPTSIDGVALANGDRVLVKDETGGNQLRNGIYAVTNAATGAWERALDFNSAGEAPQGYETFVNSGTQAGQTFALATAAVTIGTTAQTWNRVDQAPAYDVVLSDTLPSFLNLTSISAMVAGTNMPAGVVATPTVTTGAGGNFSITFDRLPSEVSLGAALVKTVTVTVNATVINTALAGQGISNKAVVRYSSLPGANGTVGGLNVTGSSNPGAAGTVTGERTGVDIVTPTDNIAPLYNTTALNNYAVAATVNTTLNTPTIDKQYKDGSISADDTSLSTSLLNNVVIGEQLTYDILVTLPEGITNAVSVFDSVPFGLRVDSFSIVTTAGGGGSFLLTNNYSGAAPATIAGTTATPFQPASAPSATFTYNFGNITVPANGAANDTAFVIRVNATVVNILTNQSGTVLNQPASMTYSDPDDLSDAALAPVTVSVSDPNTANDPSFTVAEPVLTILKNVNITGADAGDTVTYTVTIANPAINTYAAYDVTFRDVIDSSLTNVILTGVTSTGFTGGTFVTPVLTDFRFNAGQIELNPAGPLAGDLDMNAGSQIVLTFTADLAGTVSTGQVIPNKVDVFWTTLNLEDVDGSDADERTGAGIANPSSATQATPVTILNDQAISSAVIITAVAPVVVSHSIVSTSQPNAVTTGTNLAIGEFATIRVTVSLPEGVTRNLTITELLPAGYAFVPGSVVLDATHPDVTSLNDTHPPFPASATSTAAFGGSGLVAPTVSRVAAGTNFQNGDDVRFTFTSPITTTGDNDLNNNTFSFSYQVLALDVATNDGLGPVQTSLTPTASWVVGDVIAASTVNIAGFSAALGAVGTGGFAGAPTTLDGVTLANNDLILVKDQTTQSQNGIYRVINAATGSWERWVNFDQSNEISAGYHVEVVRGTVNIGTAYTQTTAGVIINTSNIVFTPIVGANPVLVDTTSAGNPNAQGITATIVEPALTIAKSVVVNGSGTVGDAGDPATYTITVAHNAAAPNISTENAYDLNLTDALPAKFVPSSFTATLNAVDVSGKFNLTGQNFTTTGVVDLPLAQSLIVTISGTLTSAVQPNDSVSNTANLTYNTLPDPTTAKTTNLIDDTTPAPGGVNTTEDSERQTAISASVNFTVPNPTYAKSLFSTDQAFTTGSNVAIGEQVTYALLTTLPEGTAPSLVITDILPPGLQYVSSSFVTTALGSGGLLGADFKGTVLPPTVTGGATNGDDVVFTFSSITTNGDNLAGNNSFLVLVTARVLNVNSSATVNQSGGVLSNTATFNIPGVTLFTSPAIDVTVVEPQLTIAHTITTSTVGLDAFDTVTYQIVIDNLTTNGATTDAFDAAITDVLPTGFNITAFSAPVLTNPTVPANLPTVDVPLAVVGGTTLTGTFDIPLGGIVTFTVTTVLPNTVTPNTVYTADANVFYSSLNGSNAASGTSTGERTGQNVADPEDNTPPTVNATLNNYAVGADCSITTVQPFSVTKSLAFTSHTVAGGTVDPDLAIGEVATFQLDVTVMEGTTNNLLLVDTLPAGLTFVPGSAAVFNANGMTINAFNVSLAGQVLTLTATSVVNPGNVDNAAAADTDAFQIRYQAVASNVAGNQATNTKTNSVNGSATGVPPDNNNQITVTIREPVLTMDKALTVSGLDAGDLVTYTVTITNTGDAAAYDLVLKDTLDTDLTLNQGALTPATALAITTQPTGNYAILDNTGNTAGALNASINELRVGHTIVLTLTARVAQSSNPGDIVSNSATLTWTSLPGIDPNERTGSGGVNDYTITDAAADFTLATPTIGKAVVSTANSLGSGQFVAGNPDVTIGEVITYDITVTFTEGVTNNTVIVDNTQDTATGRLEILSAVIQSTGANLSFGAPTIALSDAVGANGINDRATITLGTVTNTFDNTANAADQLVIRVTARPVDTSTTGVGGPNVNGVALANTASLSYGPGPTVTTTPPVNVDVVEPALVLTKSSNDADGSVSFGQLITYTVTVTNLPANGSHAPAYDVVIRDLLPTTQLGLVVGTVSTSAGTVTTGNTAGDATVLVTVPQFDLNAANITITYQAYVIGTTSPIDNTAKVFYDSLPADEPTNFSGTYIPSGDGTPDRDYGAVLANEVFNANTDPLQDTERLTLGTASIGDFVWNDRDADTVQEIGDPPIPGVVVYVDLNLNGVRDATEPFATANAAGLYTISNLAAGTYTVRVDTSTLPGGLTETYDLTGSQSDSSALVTLTAGQIRTDVDFGYVGNASLGDYVWNDRNGNGVQEAGEPPLPGVTVFIDTNNNGLLEASEARAVTDAAGHYTIGGLPAGTYNVRVLISSLPAGLTPTFDLDGTGTASQASVTLAAAQNRTDVDFGYQGNASLGDYVWNDRNGNGVQEVGEPPLAGVTVFIDTNNNGILEATEASAVTNAAGLYIISGLPAGTYNVRVDTTTLPAGLTPTFDLDGIGTPSRASVPLVALQNRTDVDFGYQGNASLGDYVWNDLNGNGVQEVGEPPLVGVTVFIDRNGNGTLEADEPRAVTDATGAYTIGGLPAGTYVVRVDTTTLPAGLTPTFDLDGIGTANSATATLAVGQNRTDVDFGYQGNASLGDYVWNDRNGNGAQEAGEPPLPGVTVFIDTNNNGLLEASEARAVTDASGLYIISGLPAGTFNVRVLTSTLPLGLTPTYDLDGIGTPSRASVTLVAAQNRTDVDFGYQGNASLGDFVWNDLNGNGVQDPLEPGIPNVRVYLDLNGNSAFDAFEPSALTNTSGSYTIGGLPAGTYTVRVDSSTLPGGVTQTYDLNGALDNTAVVTLTAGQTLTTVDYGYIGNASIGDLVWSDENGNAVFDGATELGISGITISLIRDLNGNGIQDGADSVIATTTTNGAGNYLFTGLIPGSYLVDVTDTANLLDGTTQTGAAGVTDPEPVTVAAGDVYLLADFGYRGSAQISGFVYNDADNDGVRDPGEAGISGVTITLTGTNDFGQAVSRTTTTDASGFYSFTFLHDGTYTLTETTQPTGFADGIDTPGTFAAVPTGTATGPDSLTAIAIPPGGTGIEFNFGEIFSGFLGKTIVSTTDAATTGTNVAIGETVRFRLVAEIQQGTLVDVQLRDNLPAGLRFLDDGSATAALVSTSGAPGAITSTLVAGANAALPVAGVIPSAVLPDAAVSTSATIDDDTYVDGSDVFFKFGTVVNNDLDADSEYIVVEFNAIVVNNLTTNNGNVLSNTFTLRFDRTGDNVADDDRTSAPVTVTVVEPDLNITKTLLTSTVGVEAGDTVTYQIVINHTGTSTANAYDLNLTDTLPASLGAVTLVSATITDTVSAPINAAGLFTVTGNALSTTGNFDLLRDTGGAGNHQVLTLVIKGTVVNSIHPTDTINNSGTVTWSSQDGVPPDPNTERDGDGGNGGADHYTDSSSAPTITVPGVLNVTKSVVSAATVRIGDTITYELTIGLIEGTTNNLQIIDTLPAGVAYVAGSANVFNANGMTVNGFTAGLAGQVLTLNSISVLNPGNTDSDGTTDTDTFVIRYQALVQDVAGNTNGTVLTNVADATADGTPPDSNNTASVTVIEPLLQIVKSVNDNTPHLGQTVAYSLTITHQLASTSIAHNVELRDLVPAGLTLNTGSLTTSGAVVTGSTIAGNSISYSFDQLAIGGTITVNYTATVSSSSAIFGTTQDNTAKIYWDSLPTVEPNNAILSGTPDGTPDRDYGAVVANEVFNVDTDPAQDTERVTVIGPDMSISKTDGVTTTTPGATLTYELTVSNIGTDVGNFSVTDTIPPFTSFVSASLGGVNSGGIVTWSGQTLPSGATAPAGTYSVTVQVNATVPVTAINIFNTSTVTLDAPDIDPTPANNTSTDTDVIDAISDMTINKDDGGVSILPTQTVVYTLTYANVGKRDATVVVITDTIPLYTTFVSAGSTAGWSFTDGDVAGTAGTLNIGNVAAGAGGTATIALRVVGNVPFGVPFITNTATIDRDNTFGLDPTPGDNTSTDTTPIPTSDLSLTKTVDDNVPDVGQNVLFTITVSNAGPDTATNVAVSDVLPAGLAFVGSVPSQGGYVSGSGVWTVGTLTNGASATLLMTATVLTPAIHVNSAQVSASDQYDPDSTPNNNVPGEDDQDSVTLTPQIVDLSIVKTVSDPKPILNTNVVWTMVLSNAGPDIAHNVTVLDLLPAGLTFVASNPSQGSYNNGTGIWNVGTVNNGSSATLQITTTVTTVNAITNIAQVQTCDEFDLDSTPGNNVPTEDDQSSASIAAQQAELGVIKTVDNARPNVGQNILYTMILTNNGPGPATNVTASDPLPAGLTFVAATATQGTYNSTTGLWDIGSVDVGEMKTLVITARVDITSPILNVIDITHSDQDDPILPNNHASVLITPQLASLKLVKTVDDSTPFPGANLVYKLTLTNSGPDAATNVIVQDKLPAGLTYISSTPSQGTYDAVSGNWTVGTVDNGATATLLITVATTNTDTFVSIDNKATITTVDQFNPSDTPTTTTSTTTVIFNNFEPMNTACFGAKFFFGAINKDQLVFLGNIDLPTGFSAAGQKIDFDLVGFKYSCVLDAKGRNRTGTTLAELRKVGKLWRVSLRVNREDLQSKIQGASNETVKTTLANKIITVGIAGKVYATKLDPLYTAVQNKRGTLVHRK